MRLNAQWWWIDRWRKSTAYTGMTLEEQGAYRNLLDEATLRGGAIPNSEDVLARACGDARRWRKVRPAVMAKFELKDDGWRNETLDAVIAESRRRSEKQSSYRNRTGNASGNGNGNSARPHLDPDPEIETQSSSERTEGSLRETTLPQRAGAFCQWYAGKHSELFDVGYIGNPNKDYETALRLCAVFGDQELRDAAVVWFGMRDKFAVTGTRTIPKFASRASECVQASRDVSA